MTDISQLQPATLPLSGTEYFWGQQNGQPVRIAVSGLPSAQPQDAGSITYENPITSPAVVQSMQQRLSGESWVEDFGVTGTSDDTAVVQSALTEIGEAVANINAANPWQIFGSGPLLRFRSGRLYTINPSIGLSKPPGFNIDARGAIIGTPESLPITVTLSPMVNPDSIGASWNDEIKGGQWYCINFVLQGSGTSSLITWSQAVTLKDLGMFGWDQAGSYLVPEAITIGECSTTHNLVRCYITGYDTAVHIIGHTSGGLATRGHSRITVAQCHFNALGQTGTSGTPSGHTTPGDGITGTGVWLDKCGSDGDTLMISDLLTEGADYVCYFNNNPRASDNSGLDGAGSGGGESKITIRSARAEGVCQFAYCNADMVEVDGAEISLASATPISGTAINAYAGRVDISNARVFFATGDSTSVPLLINRANDAQGSFNGEVSNGAATSDAPKGLQTIAPYAEPAFLVSGVLYVLSQGSGSFKFQWKDEAGYFSGTEFNRYQFRIDQCRLWL